MRPFRSFATLGLAVLGALACVAPTACASPAPVAPSARLTLSGEGGAAARAAAPTLRWRQLTGRLNQPTDVVAAPDGTSRLFVVEKPGVVRVWAGGHLLRRPYLDIRRRVSTDAERGLLSLAFPTDFRQHPVFYAYYTRRDGDIVLARFRAGHARATHVDAATGRVLLRIEHSTYDNHNGGQLAFGPDGYLYMGTGDGGGGGDPFRNGQDRRALLGKILRLDVSQACGATPYCTPATNPYAGAKRGRDEVFLTGLRNPWRFSFDVANGDLWIGDVGQDAWEEIDHLGPAAAGANLGWSCWEARHRYNPDQCRRGANYRFPVVAIPHPTAESITGGYVYRGSLLPRLRGTYVFGDFETGKVWTLRPGGSRVLQSRRLPGVTSFGVDDSGELLAVGIGGQLWRLRGR
jgi:glucose/arabinose dehydrogenase